MPKLNTVSDRIYFLKIGAINLILFLLVYAPTNHIFNGISSFQPYFQWEKMIPLIDWMIIPYLSLNLLFLLPLFFLTKRQLKILGLAFALSTICAGVCFIIFPIQPEFIRVIPNGFTEALYSHLYGLDNARNLFPSLHVTYAMLYFLSCFYIFKSKTGKILFSLWIVFIIVSTLFTHQHHVIDIASGITLACATYWATTRILRRQFDQPQP
jgi:membrane-associated phospholipid phosphatase